MNNLYNVIQTSAECNRGRGSLSESKSREKTPYAIRS